MVLTLDQDEVKKAILTYYNAKLGGQFNLCALKAAYGSLTSAELSIDPDKVDTKVVIEMFDEDGESHP